MNTCKTCKWWKRASEDRQDSLGQYAGYCSHDAFVCPEESPFDGKVPRNGLRYWDQEGESAGFETGENFGCIHWEKQDEHD
jgi:hypothetical protein